MTFMGGNDKATPDPKVKHRLLVARSKATHDDAMADNITDRIALAIERTGMRQNAIANELGITPQSITSWLKTGRISKENLIALARLANMDPEDILTGHRTEFLSVDDMVASRESPPSTVKERRASYLRPIAVWDDQDDLPDEQFVYLPKLDHRLSCGTGGPDHGAVEQTDKAISFTAKWVRDEGWSPRTHFTMRAHGDSMNPSIQHGAPVVIDTSYKGRTIVSGKVYAIYVDGEPLLKRLDRLPGQRVRVRSDNPSPEFAPFEVDESALEIIGRAVWTPHRL